MTESHPGKFGQEIKPGSWVMHVSRHGSGMYYQVGQVEKFKTKNREFVRWEMGERRVIQRPPEVKAWVNFVAGHGDHYPAGRWVLLDHLVVIDPATLRSEIHVRG